MIEELDSGQEIARIADRLLHVAGAHGRLPTPVPDIVAAARLSHAQESLLSDRNLASAPAHLRKALTRVRFKVRAAVDLKEREIHLSPEVERSAQRPFKELHEVTHGVLPWQAELAYADDDYTLSARVRDAFEQEANQGAAELLFQGRFANQLAGDYVTGLAAVVDVANLIGASIQSMLRRYAEGHSDAVAALVIDRGAKSPNVYVKREAMSSRAWREQFSDPRRWPRTWPHSCSAVKELLDACRTTGNSAEGTVTLVRSDGEERQARVEVMSNHYFLLVLIWIHRKQRFKLRRRLAS